MNLANLTEDDERKVIAVDFDKTLTTGDGPDFWEDDEQEYPNEEMASWVNEQYHEGHVILIWTARPWTQAATIESYLVKWGVEYHGLRCNKTGADLYVDDKDRNVKEVESSEVILFTGPEGEEWTEEDIEEFMESIEDDTYGSDEEDNKGDEEDDTDTEDDTDFFNGTVDFYNKTGQYDFIESEDFERNVFFHMGDLNAPEPEEGYEVTFKYEESDVTDVGPCVTEFYNVDPPV